MTLLQPLLRRSAPYGRGLFAKRTFSASPLSSISGGMEPPLKGIKVVDLTRVLAGPYGTMLLADLGADVIKIEHPTRGDDTRAWYPPAAPLKPDTPPTTPTSEDSLQTHTSDWSNLPPESAYYLSVNRQKRSLAVNLKHEKGQEVVKQLVKDADVLVENYVPGKLDEFGLGYEQLNKINPRLIYASVTGYGQTGPYSSNPGYDVMIEAEAGLMHITGEPDSNPVKVGVAITDLTTGLYIHGAVMAALLSRAKTGKGTWIDASLFESQIASLANIGHNWLIGKKEATRQGTKHPSIVPYQSFPTKDGYILIGCGNEKQFKVLSTALSREDWVTDPRFANNSARVENREELITQIIEALSKHTTNEWLDKLRGKGMPFAPINNIEQTFAHPQATARKVVSEVEHPRSGPVNLLSPAVTYNGEKMPIRRAPPVLGQHTIEILKELGHDEGAIKDMYSEDVI